MQMLQERIGGFDGLGRHRLVDYSLVVRESAPGRPADRRAAPPSVVRLSRAWIYSAGYFGHTVAMDSVTVDDTPGVRASQQDGTYPRPQLLRAAWADLSGPWAFCFDDENKGLAGRWYADPSFGSTIVVPFPPESPASTIHDTSHHTIAWYHRDLSASDLAEAGRDAQGSRVLLHFGAVDYRCKVWLNGSLPRRARGRPHAVQLRRDRRPRGAGRARPLVVRVEDDPLDVSKPRGKQDWQADPHSIWYHRTTGIWQPVWLEAGSRGLDPVSALGARRAVVLRPGRGPAQRDPAPRRVGPHRALVRGR